MSDIYTPPITFFLLRFVYENGSTFDIALEDRPSEEEIETSIKEGGFTSDVLSDHGLGFCSIRLAGLRGYFILPQRREVNATQLSPAQVEAMLRSAKPRLS